MPRIPTYDQQLTPQGELRIASTDTGANDILRGASSIAQAARGMAGSIVNRQEAVQRKAEADDVSTMNLDLAKGEVQWSDYLRQKMESQVNDPTGFAGSVTTDFDKWAAELRGKAKTPRGQMMAEMGITQMRGRLESQAKIFEAERGVQIRGEQFNTSNEYRQKLVRTSPGEYDRSIEEAAAALQSANLGASRDKAWLNTKQALSQSAVEGLIERDPYGTLKKLRAEPGKSGVRAIEDLTADDRDRALSAAEAETRRREAEARARAAEARQGISDAEADAFAAKSYGLPATLPNRAAYIGAYGADEGAKRYAQKSQLFGAFDVVSAAILLPPSEGAAAVAAYRPTQQTGAADQAQISQAVAGMYAQQRKAFEADPAGTLVGRDPQLKSLLDSALQPGADPAAVQNYVRRVVSAQQAAGITSRRVLPAPLADKYAADLAFDPKKPERRTQMLQALRQQWGNAFPAVIAQVAPMSDGTARVLVGMTPENGSRLDSALSAGGKKALSKVVPEQDGTMFREALSRELRPFADTLKDNVDFEARYGEHYDAAEVMGLSLMARGETPRNAAKMAAAAVVNDQYQYEGTARIPKDQPAPVIMAGAQAAQNAAITSERLAIKSSTWSDDAAAQAELKDTVRRNGYWVTNEDGSGLVLMIAHNRGSSAVYRADGSRYAFTWEELADMASKRANVPGYVDPRSPTYTDPLATGNRQ